MFISLFPLQKIFIPLKIAKAKSKISEFGSSMQRKYNMALQHFYQAATNSSAEDDNNLKSRLNDLSGSEEELFSTERSKADTYELKEKNKNGKFADYNENTYFSFNKKNKMTVKRVKPVGLCSLKGCGIFWLWCFLFLIGVFSMTYFLKIAIGKIQPDVRVDKQPVVYERYHENTNSGGSSNKGMFAKGDLHSCSDFSVEKLWHQTFEKFQTESAIRMFDVNRDGIDDIITGFVTSLDSAESDLEERRRICKNMHNNIFPCFGGVYAVNGKNGNVLWTHFSMHDIYSVNCNADIDQDGVPDCLAAGRGGAFEAVSGKTGKLLWVFLGNSTLHFVFSISYCY